MSTDGDELGAWLETAGHTIDQAKALAWIRKKAKTMWSDRKTDLLVSSSDLYALLRSVLREDPELGLIYVHEGPWPEGPGKGSCWMVVIKKTRVRMRGLPW